MPCMVFGGSACTCAAAAPSGPRAISLSRVRRFMPSSFGSFYPDESEEGVKPYWRELEADPDREAGLAIHDRRARRDVHGLLVHHRRGRVVHRRRRDHDDPLRPVVGTVMVVAIVAVSISVPAA